MKFIQKNWKQVFKYSVYLFLFTNVFLFLRKEWMAAAHRFPDGYEFSQLIEVFPSTIDTAAWFLLLMVFELETYIISDNILQQKHIQWLLRILRGFGYIFVFYSLWGYISAYIWLSNFEKLEITAICDLTGQSWMEESDSFKKITEKNCSKLSESTDLLQFKGKNIYTDATTFQSANWLGIAGIINSLTWILILIILEIDVWLQLKNRFTNAIATSSKYTKNVLYMILIILAVYWGMTGKFLDFWDAFMWIVAFFFIEMNLIEWREEKDE